MGVFKVGEEGPDRMLVNVVEVEIGGHKRHVIWAMKRMKEAVEIGRQGKGKAMVCSLQGKRAVCVLIIFLPRPTLG